MRHLQNEVCWVLFIYFHSRKCIWKCLLRNGGTFVSASRSTVERSPLWNHFCYDGRTDSEIAEGQTDEFGDRGQRHRPYYIFYGEIQVVERASILLFFSNLLLQCVNSRQTSDMTAHLTEVVFSGHRVLYHWFGMILFGNITNIAFICLRSLPMFSSIVFTRAVAIFWINHHIIFNNYQFLYQYSDINWTLNKSYNQCCISLYLLEASTRLYRYRHPVF